MHYSVLLNESIELLAIKADGVYIDGTFGRGGHSREILKNLGTAGRLIAFDKDIEAVNYAKVEMNDPRFFLIHDSFASMPEHLEQLGIEKIDGVLLDLGVSSPQVDTASRGFSFRFDAPLDMRMDNTQGQSAREWINQASETEISDILWKYGEEKFSRKIAKNIVEYRNKEEIVTTLQLAKIIATGMMFKEKGQHPATRSFQAIRIYINNELGDLEGLLSVSPKFLKPGARVVVISFHSLEDRIVKNKFNDLVRREQLPKWVTSTNNKVEYAVIAKKVRADIAEVTENVRSRSAIMRALEKL